jgi:hypothetical protein
MIRHYCNVKSHDGVYASVDLNKKLLYRCFCDTQVRIPRRCYDRDGLLFIFTQYLINEYNARKPKTASKLSTKMPDDNSTNIRII